MDLVEELADDPGCADVNQPSSYVSKSDRYEWRETAASCSQPEYGPDKQQHSIGVRLSSRKKTEKSMEYPSTNSKKYQCGMCDASFSSRVFLNRHKMVEHALEKTNFCAICNETFPNEKALESHKLIHQEVECPVCKKQIGNKASLELHIQQSHSTQRENVLPCPICDKKLRDKHSLKCHLVAVHTNKTIKCLDPNCNKMFSNESYMKSHYRAHVDEKPYECDVCKQQFKTKSYMEKHQKSHSGHRPHTCSHCGRSYLTVSHLNAHVKVHTGERPFQCAECGKCFRLKRHLLYHSNLHSGDKPFECEICGYKTGFKSNWYAHRKRHVGQKEFECYVCQKHFFDRHGLLKHLLAHERKMLKDNVAPAECVTPKQKVKKVLNLTLTTDEPLPDLDETSDLPTNAVGQLVQLVTLDGKPLPSILLLQTRDQSLRCGPLIALDLDAEDVADLDEPVDPLLDVECDLEPPGLPIQKIVHITDQSLASTIISDPTDLPTDDCDPDIGDSLEDDSSFALQPKDDQFHAFITPESAIELQTDLVNGGLIVPQMSESQDGEICIEVPKIGGGENSFQVRCNLCNEKLSLVNLTEHLQNRHEMQLDSC